MASDGVMLAPISLPDFGLPRQLTDAKCPNCRSQHRSNQPVVGRAEYENRIESARARATRAGLDFLLVYGDREHSANLAYLTDHDPRFEEALLVIAAAGGKPILILGNEGLTYAQLVAVDVERRLYQGFSLPGKSAVTALGWNLSCGIVASGAAIVWAWWVGNTPPAPKVTIPTTGWTCRPLSPTQCACSAVTRSW